MEKYYGWWLPIDISTHGVAIDRLIIVLHIFMVILFVGWFTFLIYTLVRFRARPGHKANYKLDHFKAPTYLEIGVAVFEFLLLFGLAIPFWNGWRNNAPDKAQALEVRVVAEQFAWNIHYPGKDGLFGKTDPKLMKASNPVGLDPNDMAGKDDIVTINQMHVPVDTPIIAHLSSKDVIHSFGIPVMRVKQDVIPGQRIPVWFEAKKSGNFEIVCGQLCGLGHYRMRGYFIVDPKDKYQEWFEAQTAKKLGIKKPAVPAAVAAPAAAVTATPVPAAPAVVAS